MGYLDSNGLAHLWGKIKAALGQKLDAGDGLTAEQADERYLKLTGGTLSGGLKIQTATGDDDVATEGYVDAAITSALGAIETTLSTL